MPRSRSLARWRGSGRSGSRRRARRCSREMGATERGSRNAGRAAPRRARSRGLEVALARKRTRRRLGEERRRRPRRCERTRPPAARRRAPLRPTPPPPPSAPPRPGPARIGRRPWQVAAASIALGLALAPLGPGTALVVGALPRRRAHGPGAHGRSRRWRCCSWWAARWPASGVWPHWIPVRSASTTAGRSRSLPTWCPARAPPYSGSTAEIEVADGSPLEGARLLLRLPRWVEAPKADIGAELGLEGRLRLLEHSEPGPASFDWAAHLRRHGVAGEYLADRVRLTGAGAAVWRACSIASARAPSVVSARTGPPARAPWREAWCSARTRRSTRACARTSGTPDWLTCWP